MSNPALLALFEELITDEDLAKCDRNVDAALADGADVDPALVAMRRRRGNPPQEAKEHGQDA